MAPSSAPGASDNAGIVGMGLRFGPVRAALHVVIDIQRLFAEPTAWHCSAIPGLLPAIASLLAHRPDAAAFARFIPAANAADAAGLWRGYYEHWDSVTTDRLAPGMLDVLPVLTDLAPTAPMLDKSGYSVFSADAFAPLLGARQTDTLILSGVETDVCLLSTVFEAVDRGLRVIVVADAVASSDTNGHTAALSLLARRFDQQVEIATAAEIAAAWSTQ